MFEAIKEAGGPDKGLWGIGVDVDMGKNPNLYPAGTLTSALKHVDFATYVSVKSIVDGTFTPGVITLSLRNGGVGWAEGNVAKVLSAAQIAKINTLRQDIIDGKITPPEDPDKGPGLDSSDWLLDSASRIDCQPPASRRGFCAGVSNRPDDAVASSLPEETRADCVYFANNGVYFQYGYVPEHVWWGVDPGNTVLPCD